jgi:hypothetical protein
MQALIGTVTGIACYAAAGIWLYLKIKREGN